MTPAGRVLTQADLLSVIVHFQFGVPQCIGEQILRYHKEIEHKFHRFRFDASHGTKYNAQIRGYILCRLIEQRKTQAALQFLNYFSSENSIKVPPIESKLMYTMDNAARARSLPLLQLLHTRHLGECSSAAMDVAAANGDYEIVEFLHCHRREGCTAKGFAQAKRNGHLDIVAFLHDNRYDQDRIEYFARKEAQSELNAPFMIAMTCSIQ